MANAALTHKKTNYSREREYLQMEPQAEHITSQCGKLSIDVQYTNECSDPVSVAKNSNRMNKYDKHKNSIKNL